MPQVFTSTVVGAPVGEVWALLRGFAAIGSWHPALPPCEIGGGPADRVGCIRVFPLAGGHREILSAWTTNAGPSRSPSVITRLAAGSQVPVDDGRPVDYVE